MTETGTALLAPDQAAREHARIALRERLATMRADEAAMGLKPGEGLSGTVPVDLLEYLATLGTEVDPVELAVVQSLQAYELVTRDVSRAVWWGWPALDELVGPMLPGELWIVGATTGNGKSTFLHNWQAGIARRGVTTLCFPLEIEPEYFRLRTACRQLNIDLDAVVSHDWAALGSTEADVRAWVQQWAFFQNAGYRGLYNMNLGQPRRMRGVPDARSPLDFMGKTELAANLFRITQTEEKIKRDGIYGQADLEDTAESVGRKVRRSMMEISGTPPERLPTASDIRGVKRELKDANKTLKRLDKAKKLPKPKTE